MCISVRFVGKRTNHHKRSVVFDANNGYRRSFHLTGVSVVIAAQFLYIFAVCNKLVACSNRSLEDVIFPDDFSRGVVSELHKLRITIVVNARLASEAGIARTLFKSVI